ncbi:MAG: hypothetical protein V1820_04675 [archaeon]
MASGTKIYKVIPKSLDIDEDALLASIELKEQSFKESASKPGLPERIALPDDPFSEDEAGEKKLLSATRAKSVFTEF